MHALVIASRFGLLLGLALWLGLGSALLVSLPVIDKRLPLAQAQELTGALTHRIDRLLFVALALVVLGLGSRAVLDRAAPPTGLVVPVAVMALSRLLAALAVSPTLGALHRRLQAVDSPASADERTAFSRLAGARVLLLSLEVCLCLYAFLAVS